MEVAARFLLHVWSLLKMNRSQREALEEARRIQLEEHCFNELDDMVDYRTGEILSTREYVSQPMGWEGLDLTPPPSFGAITSYTQMQRFMITKDRRRLKLFNGCRAIYDMDKGKSYFEKTRVVFPTHVMLKLSRLVERIDYRNVIVTTPKNLSACMEVRHSNLHRQLHLMKGMIKVSGPKEGVCQGNIKVEVSPVYGFRYESGQLDYVRESEVVNWYRSIFEGISRSYPNESDTVGYSMY